MSSPGEYIVRGATAQDHAALLELAKHLNTVNLPADAEALRALLRRSERSFRRQITDPNHRQYVFLLEERATGRVVGTSMILAKLGRRDMPYAYFDMHREERYSSTLNRHFVHHVLSMNYAYDGPTELGGLVVLPQYRRHAAGLGRMISYMRFLWIAMHREDFQDELLVELLPPLKEDGTSYLWEAIGRRFTGLSYRDADRLSKMNKEFIRGLFPRGDIYVPLLPEEARNVLGKVGKNTKGVQTLIERLGFRYANRVDPFDGGPHFLASTDNVPLVQHAMYATPDVNNAPRAWVDGFMAYELDEPPFVYAWASPMAIDREGSSVTIPAPIETPMQPFPTSVWVTSLNSHT